MTGWLSQMGTNCYLIAKMISVVDVIPAVSSLGMFLAESQGHSDLGKAKKKIKMSIVLPALIKWEHNFFWMLWVMLTHN